MRLVRHGESEGNVGLLTEDPATIVLTANGIKQAEELASGIDSAPDLIVVSPYFRTQQTAAPLIRRFPEVPVKILPVQEFTYLSPQKYRGTSEAQRRVFSQAYWHQCDPDRNDGEGSESFSDLIRRIDDLLVWLSGREHRDVLIFTHEHFIRALLLRREYPDVPVDTGFMTAYREARKSGSIPNATAIVLGPVTPPSLGFGIASRE